MRADEEQLDWFRAVAYFEGTSTPEARAELERWIDADPEHSALLGQLRVLWEQRQHPRSVPYDREAVTAHVLRTIRSGSRSATEHRPRRSAPIAITRGALVRWALGAFAVVLMIVGTRALVSRPQSPQTLAHGQTYRAALGQRTIVPLAGGSVMTLAPGTMAQVTATAVAIQGEAYFEIVPQADRPFTVTTANAAIHVLGTRFTVRQYATERRSRVVVQDGKVSLRRLASQEAPVVLTARMLSQVSDSGVTVTTGVSVGNYIGWVQGRLVFSKVPLTDVVTELARAYGVDIQIADTVLARQPMTLKAEVGTQSLTQLLDFIGYVTDAHYTRTGNVFVLVPGRAAMRDTPKTLILQPEKSYGR